MHCPQIVLPLSLKNAVDTVKNNMHHTKLGRVVRECNRGQCMAGVANTKLLR